MYLPEDISNDYRFAFEQRRYQNSRPYYPHFCSFIFKIDPLIVAEEGYAESDELYVGKLPWKMFVKSGGKGLYPFMIVGVVDHNNVEEISYKITLQGIKAEYNEKRKNSLNLQ
uniref:Uncharacterized protein n=1 Tax=Panagrolaimus sp. ES5 TaxID=591445 RepID=A0AC34GRQ1_9BILA